MPPLDEDEVAFYAISQATTATFSDLYLRLTFLFFIQTGSKRVWTDGDELVAEEGDLLIFPAGSIVTMENRPVPDRSYRAIGLSFPDDLVRQVFGYRPAEASRTNAQILRRVPHDPAALLPLFRATLENPDLPPLIRRHRLTEPLLWVQERGIDLAIADSASPVSRVRRLIATDPSYAWRAREVARHLAKSEATLRRELAAAGQGFARILHNTRLEHGLSLLQTTHTPISEVALASGFKTPSHFSDAFRTRFGIRPRDIRTAEP
ncbi:MAG: AraC family transcriptional regulator [Pseudomonadota bacterium]